MANIIETIRRIGGGAFLAQLNDELAELVKKVDASDKNGALTLTIGVKKATKSGAMTIVGKSTLKNPPEEPMEALLFATPDGNLVPDNPHQQKLDLKVVSNPKAKIAM